MKTLDDIFMIAVNAYHAYHTERIECHVIPCRYCGYSDRCLILCCAICNLLETGEYH